jgi:hypothetical protein
MSNKACAMRSRRADRMRVLARVVLAAACAFGAASGTSAQDAGAAPPASSASSTDPRAVRIESAVDKLRADPLLSGKHKEHRLRWKDGAPQEKTKDKVDPSIFEWFASLARFINDISRFLLWGVMAVLVALALVSLRHVVQLRAFRRAKAASAVSHVRDLDVRPESLPDDVGAAAWALWQSGQVPVALSLLYRGALSRLIHQHAVPISSATTEGECLDLARGRLEPAALRYLTPGVRAWEANIYGNRALSDAMGEALCSGFAARLDAAPVHPPAAAGSAP